MEKMIKIFSDNETIFMRKRMVHDISMYRDGSHIELTIAALNTSHTIRIYDIDLDKNYDYYQKKIHNFADKVFGECETNCVILELRSR